MYIYIHTPLTFGYFGSLGFGHTFPGSAEAASPPRRGGGSAGRKRSERLAIQGGRETPLGPSTVDSNKLNCFWGSSKGLGGRKKTGLRADIKRKPYMEVNSKNFKKLEYVPGTGYAGFSSSLGFAVGGHSYSNFLASAYRRGRSGSVIMEF